MPELQATVDALTVQALRARGGEAWAAVPEHAIAAWVAEMSFPVAPVVRDALADLVDRGELGYVSAQRRRTYEEAVAGWYGREHGHRIDPDHVHAVGDVIEAYRKALASLPGGAHVVVPVPSYPPFLFVAAEEGRRVVTIPSSAEDGIDLDALDAALAPDALLVLCNPSNPFGRVSTRDELATIAEVVERRGARVLADEIHAPLVLDPQVAHVPYASVNAAAAAHSMTAFSASKAYNLPGLKSAALITANERDQRWWTTLGAIPSHGASIAGIVASTAALDDDGGWLADVRAYLLGNRDLVHATLREMPALRATPPAATYLQWVEHVEGSTGSPTAALAARGLVVTDGAAFGGFDHAFRLNFALPRPVLVRALAIVAETFSAASAVAR
ncbi:pyridoxal phosphate-dependent aminotransferase [Agrococcus versicolor]|uniref:cysteine-S-conjugate beta-lyase n=1 Tax=Agrococcus versicolor TaxID=501482 RepID=A0ABN3AWX7_9MICO